MLATFIEGVGETVLPCSMGLLAPGLAALLLGWWRSLLAYLSFAAAAALVAWARAADSFALDWDWVLAAVLVGAVGVAWGLGRAPIACVGSGALAGLFAGSTWRPCVGDQLGTILNTAPDDPMSQLLPMAVYIFGVTLVLGLLALVPIVWPKLRTQRPRVALLAGSVLALAIAVGQLTGLYGDVLSEFAQLSVR